MEWLLSWEVSSVVVAVLIGVAFAVLSLNDFKIAKAFFLFAAMYAAAGVFMWEAHSTLSSSQQVGLGAIALLLDFLLVVAACRYVDRKEIAKKREAQPSPEEFARGILEEIRRIEGMEPSKSKDEPQTVTQGEGFAQFESRSIAIERQEDLKRIIEGDLRVGEIVKCKFTSANRGQRPILDYQSWGVVAFVDPAKNPGKQLREVMLEGLKVGYEQFKNAGSDLGAGRDVCNFAQSAPLTKEELDGLRNGTLRVHILLGGAWSDSKGNRFYWTNAEWTNWPQVHLESSFWKQA